MSSDNRIEYPATPPDLPRDPTPERLKLSPPPSTSPPRSPVSPDSRCPICLARLDNKSFTDGCMHQFCFTCIQEWSKVRAVCPLCNQSFSSIIHNVRSDLDYDRYRLPEQQQQQQQRAEDDLINRSFFYQLENDLTLSRWARRRYRFRSMLAPMLWPSVSPSDSISDVPDFHLPTVPSVPRSQRQQRSAAGGGGGGAGLNRVTSRQRRQLYLDDMWARPTADQLTGRYRETGPEFYRANPACTHRLVPWLNRELAATLSSDIVASRLAHLLQTVLDQVQRVHILSHQFRRQLQPSLGLWTEHFVHELYTYARSPYDMIGYDLNVQYGPGRPQSAHSTVVIDSSNSASASDLDVDNVDVDVVMNNNNNNSSSSSSGDGGAGGGGGGGGERRVGSDDVNMWRPQRHTAWRHSRSSDSDVQVMSPPPPTTTTATAAAARGAGCGGRRQYSAPGPSRAGVSTMADLNTFLDTVSTSHLCSSVNGASAAAAAASQHLATSDSDMDQATSNNDDYHHQHQQHQQQEEQDLEVEVVRVLPPVSARAPLVTLSDSAPSPPPPADPATSTATATAARRSRSCRSKQRRRRLVRPDPDSETSECREQPLGGASGGQRQLGQQRRRQHQRKRHKRSARHSGAASADIEQGQSGEEEEAERRHVTHCDPVRVCHVTHSTVQDSTASATEQNTLVRRQTSSRRKSQRHLIATTTTSTSRNRNTTTSSRSSRKRNTTTSSRSSRSKSQHSKTPTGRGRRDIAATAVNSRLTATNSSDTSSDNNHQMAAAAAVTRSLRSRKRKLRMRRIASTSSSSSSESPLDTGTHCVPVSPVPCSAEQLNSFGNSRRSAASAAILGSTASSTSRTAVDNCDAAAEVEEVVEEAAVAGTSGATANSLPADDVIGSCARVSPSCSPSHHPHPHPHSSSSSRSASESVAVTQPSVRSQVVLPHGVTLNLNLNIDSSRY